MMKNESIWSYMINFKVHGSYMIKEVKVRGIKLKFALENTISNELV